MPDRRFLTDRYLRSLPPAKRGHRAEVWDGRLPGFGIRVYDSRDTDPARRGKAGRIVFILYARFARGAAPTRRAIGIYGGITLQDARRIAGEWRSLIERGIDPAVVERQAREQAEREAALRIKHSFASVAEAFVVEKLARERSGKVAARELRAFIAAWGDRLIGEITTDHVLEIIRAKKRSAPEQARAMLILIRRFFNWVINQHVYGLSASPCDRLSAVKIIGPMQSRTRRLNDAELFAFWRATGRMKYPSGSVYRLLLLTGLRLNEVAQLSWPEIHDDIAIIPPERMKAKEGKAREHQVPLSSTALEIIKSLPRIKNARFVFSLSGGKRPLAMTGPIKADLDKRMVRTLRAMARRRGDDYHAVTLPEWVNHDVRRTVRSGLSALRIPHNVAEAVLAHRAPGIVGTYDGHEYLDEKREALEAWAQRLASIANPVPAAPAKVVKLRGRRR